jgi:hypothetical protein
VVKDLTIVDLKLGIFIVHVVLLWMGKVQEAARALPGDREISMMGNCNACKRWIKGGKPV